MLDCAGRPHTDFYKLIVESESRQEWMSLLGGLRAEVGRFRQAVRRREVMTAPAGGGGRAEGGGRADGGGAGGGGGLSSAAEGNLLEAINLALDVLEPSHEELDLASTGKSLLVLTGGAGVFTVDQAFDELAL